MSGMKLHTQVAQESLGAAFKNLFRRNELTAARFPNLVVIGHPLRNAVVMKDDNTENEIMFGRIGTDGDVNVFTFTATVWFTKWENVYGPLDKEAVSEYLRKEHHLRIIDIVDFSFTKTLVLNGTFRVADSNAV